MTITYELVKGLKDEPYDAFKARIWNALEARHSDDRAEMFKVSLTEEKPPALSVIPFGKEKIAAIQTRWSAAPDSVDLALEGILGLYTVSEAFPVAYDRTWQIGERTPGVCLLTLFRQRKDLDKETFLSRWHNGHTPLSLKIHPLWHYSRNVVETLAPGSARLDGIVEEHTRTREELLNPTKFFGGPLAMLPNMIRTYFDVRSFLDYSSITPYLTSEYYLKDITRKPDTR